MQSLQRWFHRQGRRDQVALILLGLVLAGYLVLQGVIQPLQQAVGTAERRVVVAEESLGRIKALAARLVAHQGADSTTAAAGTISVAARVDASSANAGLRIASMEPAADGTSVGLSLDEAPLAAFMNWLLVLDGEGIGVDSLTLLPAAQAGHVSATLRLSATR